MWVFINCLIENPAFDSQTKETLTTKQSKSRGVVYLIDMSDMSMRFGSTCELSDKVIKQARSSVLFLGASACEVMKSGIVETILDWVRSYRSTYFDRPESPGKGEAEGGYVKAAPRHKDAGPCEWHPEVLPASFEVAMSRSRGLPGWMTPMMREVVMRRTAP